MNPKNPHPMQNRQTVQPVTNFTKFILACFAVLIAGAVQAQQNGVWTNDASSVWSANTNWFNGTIADGSGAIADFTLDNSNLDTVTLDTSRSIGTLMFGNNASARTNRWIVNASGGSVLTLSGGTPTIAVSNAFTTNIASLTLPIAGTAGLTKVGNGALALGGTNTYSGPTTISGGTLQITNGPGGLAGTGGLQNGPGSLVGYYSFNNVIGNHVVNDGSGGALMDGTMVGNGGVSIGVGIGRFGDNCLNVTQGAEHNNNGSANIGNGGYVLINSPVVPFTCTAGNASANWTMAMWIKTTVAGATYMYQGSGGWASGNTVFYLNAGINGVGSGGHAGGVRNSQGWEAGTLTTVNDGNWHHIAMTCSAGTKTLYVDGAVDTLIQNAWGGNGAGNQIWIGGANGFLTDGDVSFVGLIDKVAIYNRPLSASEVQLLTNNVVPGLAAPAIPLNSPVSIAAGAKLDMNSYAATVTNLTDNGVVDTSVNGGYLGANFGSDATLNGIVTNSAGTLNFYKLGPGKLTVAGLTANNNTVIRQGTVTLSGSGMISSNGANNTIVVADSSANAILDIPNGSTVIARSLVVGGLSARGSGSGQAGAVYNRGTYLNFGNTGTGVFAIGNSTGGAAPTNNGYGYFLQDSATSLNLGETGIGGLNGGDGVFELKSGTANFTNWLTLGRCDQTLPGSFQHSLMLIRNGTVFGPSRQTTGDGVRFNWSGAGITEISVLDIGSGGKLGSLTASAVFGANVNLNNSNDGNSTAMITVSGGGSLEVFNVYSFNTAPLSVINLNNGTLSPTGTFNQFLGTGLRDVFVYAGGVTFDTKGFDAGIVPPLSAPTGNSIASIPLTGNGAGYIGRPIVQITDSTGVGATAIAEWDQPSGTITAITITSPGSGYTAPTVSLVGGGFTMAATLGTPALTPATSGGLTKLSGGTLTLSGGFTYTGDTAVLGGGLSVPSSLVTPATAGSLTVSNANMSVDASSGSALAVKNLTLQNNATNNINFGTVIANPSFAAINASGSISAPGSGLVINISGFGLKPGTFTLIKYTGTALGSIANFTLTLPPGVSGSLVNNTGNDSIDLTITAAPNQLTWSGVNGTNWDLSTTNWINDANSAAIVFQQYTNGGVIAADGVNFDDTLTNDLVNGQPTNVNLTGTFNPFPVVVNSTLPYSIAGAGSIVGVGDIIKTNTGTLTLLTSNTFTGGLAINQGTVIVTNDFSLGTNVGTVTLNGGALQVNGNTTNNSRVFSVPATSTIGVLTNVVARFGGTVSGFGGLTKIDNGTLTLAGNNTATGPLTVSQGTLSSLGTESLPAVVTVGNTASVNATLSVGGGTFNALNNGGQFTSGLLVGSVAGAEGDVRLTSGTLTVYQQFGLGGGVGAYAGFNMSGGTLLGGSYIVVGFNNDTAVFTQTSGSTTVQTNLMTIAAGGTNAIGVANFSGGTYVANDATNGNAGGRGGIFVGENGNGTLNVSGSASVTALGETNLTLGRTGAGSSGTVNLDGGTITTVRVLKGAGAGTFNFNGGTLKAGAATPVFVSGLNNAFVYNGGAVIDDSGFAVTVPQPLLAPNGFGVNTIPVTAGGSGYIDTPIVTITGGSGSNAMATATVASGQVTTVTVTCPGSGYQPTDSLSVSFSGGGANVGVPTIGTITFAANGSGGLTKKGAGTLALSGANTFTGPVTNTAGTLTLNTGSTYSALSVNAGTVSMTTASTVTGNTTISNNAVLTISQIGTATNTMGSLTLSGGAATPGATLSVGLTGLNSSVPFLNCGTFTANGTNSISLAGAISLGTIPVVKYSSLAGTGTFTNLLLPQGAGGYISNSVANSTVYVVVTNTGPGLVWAGTNSNPALTNLWDISSTTNWLLGATPTSYHQTIIPGDAVTFNDSGTGTVTLNTNAGPSSILISNNAVNYTFKGSGNISGPTGLTKLGTGFTLINLTNSTYLGDTTIGNGTLQIGSLSAVSSAANLSVGTGGTLELNGLSQTVNALNGSGIIDNNNTTNVTLTVNNGGTWSGTIHDQGAGGGVSLTKVGNSTLILGGTNRLNSPTASQVNAGLTIMTNNAALGCGSSEFWVGAVGGSTATNIVDGATLVVSNNWLVVGRGSATANGTLIVNSGTVQKSGANNIVVGSLGATGNLIVNGGRVLNDNDLWLGESPTAVATLHLNGGLIQADVVRPNDNGGLPSVTPIAYFNGGTLQATANSFEFLQVVQCQVMSNGFILDDNGFTLSLGGTTLNDGDGNGGGFTKMGSGNVYLDLGNGYTGTTVVSNGFLAGIGSVNGPVLVKSGGIIGAGDTNALGTFTLNTTPLTIQGKAAMRISKTGNVLTSDLITGISTANYGGLLVISNATTDATILANGDTFTLFSAGASSGNFAGIVGTPGPGLAYSFNPANGVLSVVTSSGPPPAPTFGKVLFSGGNVIITATNNNGAGGTYSLLATNNILAPLSNWPVVTNGTFDSNGNLALTNAVGPGRLFYILRVP
jgi:autotransporter-associated beta strand protein